MVMELGSRSLSNTYAVTDVLFLFEIICCFTDAAKRNAANALGATSMPGAITKTGWHR
jgi:hypothetical protein